MFTFIRLMMLIISRKFVICWISQDEKAKREFTQFSRVAGIGENDQDSEYLMCALIFQEREIIRRKNRLEKKEKQKNWSILVGNKTLDNNWVFFFTFSSYITLTLPLHRSLSYSLSHFSHVFSFSLIPSIYIFVSLVRIRFIERIAVWLGFHHACAHVYYYHQTNTHLKFNVYAI